MGRRDSLSRIESSQNRLLSVNMDCLLYLNWKRHSMFLEVLIPYSRSSRIDQMDFEHAPTHIIVEVVDY